jgi:photosystem II stability/assembly factor-like uncharacterized protein
MKNALNTRNTVFALLALLLFSTNAFTANWATMDSGVTEPLKGIWGFSVSEVFVVGSGGTILQIKGSDWDKMESGTNKSLQGVWGSSSTNVFAVGDDGTILKYNGSAWSPKSGGSGTDEHLNGIWGSSPSDIFVVGENGTILHCDESSCTKEYISENFSFNGIWGSSATDVFAVGGNGMIYHYDGRDWYKMESGTTKNLQGVWGSSADNVFVVGSDMDNILHYYGNDWSEMAVTKRDYYAVGGNSSIYVVAYNGKISKYSSGTWLEEDVPAGITSNFYGIWVSSEDDAFVVGSNGTILIKSTAISPVNTPPTAVFTISATTGTIDTTFYVDASECSDAQDSTDILEVRWDWENDGTWDTQYSTTKIASHQYSTDGTYTIKLEVKDSRGSTDTATNTVQVGEVDGEDDDNGCPIGKLLGEEDPRLETLRRFRDQVLEQSQTGKLLIKLYYSQEDKINGLIESNPAIAIFAKGILEAVIPVIESFVEKAE